MLERRLYTLHMALGALIKDHIGEFIALINDLKVVNAKVENHHLTILFLCP